MTRTLPRFRGLRFLLPLMLVLNGANAATPEPITGLPAPSVDMVDADGMRRLVYRIDSPSMNRRIEVVTVLPAGHSGPMPVLFALQGRDAPHTAFADMRPLTSFLADHPMILVSFDADKDSAYIDASNRQGSLFLTFFFDELVPFLDKTFPTNGQRAITGFSMGGYGATRLMAEKPAFFSSVSAMSGAFHLFEAASERWRAWESDLVGSAEEFPEAYRANFVPGRIESAVLRGKAKLPPLFLTCGTSDFLLADNRRFVDFLTAVNASAIEESGIGNLTDKQAKREALARLREESLIDFEYLESPGGHDWVYWRDLSARLAAFHWKHFEADRE